MFALRSLPTGNRHDNPRIGEEDRNRIGRAKSTLWESLTDDANKEKFVLVIEDSCDHAQSLLILLRMEGYRVECEADGRSGWNRVQAALPDLVLLDVMMPGLNGADVGKAIRSSEATEHIPILIQTALCEWQVREWFSDYDAYLQKPFNVPKMLEVVADLLRGKAV